MKLIFFKNQTETLSELLILPSDIADVMAKYKINLRGLSRENQLMIYCILRNKASLLAELLEKHDCDTTVKFSVPIPHQPFSMRCTVYELAQILKNKFNDQVCITLISEYRAKKCERLKSQLAKLTEQNDDDRDYAPARLK